MLVCMYTVFWYECIQNVGMNVYSMLVCMYRVCWDALIHWYRCSSGFDISDVSIYLLHINAGLRTYMCHCFMPSMYVQSSVFVLLGDLPFVCFVCLSMILISKLGHWVPP